MPLVALALPEAFRAYAGGLKRVELEAGTAGEALARLLDLHPDLRKRTLNTEGALHPYLVFTCNREQLDPRALDARTLREGDLLELIAAASGG